jgi:hypothetical protein
MGLESLTDLEATGEVLFCGTPLFSNELEPQPQPNGRLVRALRPSTPITADYIKNCFVADAEQPVVCMTSLAKMAIFRALGHQSHHTNLPKRQRRHGWRYENDEPVYYATAALIENVRNLGRLPLRLTARVAIALRTAAPFRPLERERHHFRATCAVRVYDLREVSAADWPAEVEECPPYPEDFDLDGPYDPYDPYDPELNDHLMDLLKGQRFPDDIRQPQLC